MDTTAPTAGRKSYDVSSRRAAARLRRQAVLKAARELLLQSGYRATTVRAIADRAGVSTEMIYKSFGDKKRLMKSLYDVTTAGDDEPEPIGSRPVMQRVLATADPYQRLMLYAKFVRTYQERLNALLHLLAEADPEMAEIRATIEGERLAGLRTFVGHLADEGQLRSDVTCSAGADACWVLTSPQMFIQLTQTRNWSAVGYERWLTDMMAASLLDKRSRP